MGLLSWFYFLFQCFFWLQRTISLVIETCFILSIYLIKYHSCSAFALAVTFHEQFYCIMYLQGCIILCVSMPPLPAWFQQKFRKSFWLGKSKLGHKFLILYVFLYWSCWLMLFSVFLLLGLAEPKSLLLLYLGGKKGFRIAIRRPEFECCSDVEIVGGLSWNTDTEVQETGN